jgi:hypothetical protein
MKYEPQSFKFDKVEQLPEGVNGDVLCSSLVDMKLFDALNTME